MSEYGHHAQADGVDAVEQRAQVLGWARHERPDAWARVRVRVRHGLRLDESAAILPLTALTPVARLGAS